MQTKAFAIGVEDFEEMIAKDYYYVDKTLLIKELLDRKGKTTLFTRPRRFGKTLNLSMLRYFFENTGDEEKNRKNRDLFTGLKICGAGDAYLEQMGQYPVISLTLKSAKQSCFFDSYACLKEEIAKEFSRHEEIVPALENEIEKQKYRNIRNRTAQKEDYLTCLTFLSECLYQVYRKKSIVLIDEYDVPLESAYFAGFYEEMVGFIRSVFESALKTNPYLEFAVITGCLRISKESIFTGLNNLEIFSVLSKRYSEYFGFVQEEVDAMLACYGLDEKKELVQRWYDGYRFGDTEVYNPWSVIKFISDLCEDRNAFPMEYWANTSSNSIVKDMIYRAELEVKQEIENLIAGETIEKKVHEEITYQDIDASWENLWNFLFFTGYLKQVSLCQIADERYVKLAIPNVEVKNIYQNQIRNWFADEMKRKDLSVLYRALLDGDMAGFERELMGILVQTISYLDGGEAFYHGFLLGVLINLDGGYLKKSNREAGDGRYDICVYNLDETKPVFIFELKVAEKYHQMGAKAEEALRQIEEKKYDVWLPEEGYRECYHVGIGFYRKRCRVRMNRKSFEIL